MRGVIVGVEQFQLSWEWRRVILWLMRKEVVETFNYYRESANMGQVAPKTPSTPNILASNEVKFEYSNIWDSHVFGSIF